MIYYVTISNDVAEVFLYDGKSSPTATKILTVAAQTLAISAGTAMVRWRTANSTGSTRYVNGIVTNSP